MPTPSKPLGFILCPETQRDDDIELQPSRVAPILLHCLLFLKGVKPPVTASNGGDPPPLNNISKIFNSMPLSTWKTNLQSVSWKDFQSLAIEFLAINCSYLVPEIMTANKDKKITWSASIANHLTYGPWKKFTVLGQLDFMAFAEAANVAYPADVQFNLHMVDPRVSTGAEEIEYVWTLGRTNNGTPHLSASNSCLLFHIKRKSTLQAGNEDRGSSFVEPDSPKHRRVSSETKDEIDELGSEYAVPNLPPVLLFPTIDVNAKPEIHTSTVSPHSDAKEPMQPPPPEMDNISLESFLSIAQIPRHDHLTRARLLINGITEWSFFRSSSEQELLRRGFSIGVARLLMEGVPRLVQYVDNENDERILRHIPASPSPLI
ncbi:hypothetical protein PCASD_04472 [Puccinia coronata f. sp. avenae]|uniref:Uncharacterized protein n=1 Tax=Puccinia coronata f. sp. avenae TaxID=200324 RepID=A0A2N5V367_9BASI|nr:hypothetical protein PCASD_04472 [Puccinia coronata f. sp. avenae]